MRIMAGQHRQLQAVRVQGNIWQDEDTVTEGTADNHMQFQLTREG
jgi:hypothetical protein